MKTSVLDQNIEGADCVEYCVGISYVQQFLCLCSLHNNINRAMTNERLSFKQRRTFAERCKDVEAVRCAHKNKIPVIIERHYKEKVLPMMDKSKFLIPDHLNMSDVTKIIRRRLQLSHSQTLYLLVQDRNMVSCSAPLAEVYERDRDDDGFLYIVFVAQESFGS